MSAFERRDALARLASEEFDVLVVGGGITGAGVALDAASRGLRTALVEKGDFASGTSSKSSKLIHGGLRYLQQREFRLVYESLAERQRLLRNAPHLVTPLPFLIPLFGRDGVVSATVARSFSTALWLYDLTGGWRIGSRHRRIGRDEALAHLPALRAEKLVAGFVYPDAHADDARLTLAVLRTAVLDYGAVAANYVEVGAVVTDRNGSVCGARVSPAVMPGTSGAFGDAAVGPDFDVRARAVVNATGVWADGVRALAEGGHPHSLRPAKGVHLSVPASSLPCDIAAVLPVRDDHRSVFVIPWPEGGVTYVGTTDTDYEGPLDDPACTPGDVDYLLSAVNASTTAGLRPHDVTAVWAGLRPLLAPAGGRRVSARTADLSRRHSVRTSPDGLVTVTGGKLTTYRRMAEDTMDAVARVLAQHRAGASSGGRPPARRSVTRGLRLRGAPARGADPAAGADRLFDRYGTEADSVRALWSSRPALREPVVDGLPYLGAEVVYAVRQEMAQSLDDVLCRRTRAALQDARAAARAAPAVAALMATDLGWSQDQATRNADDFCARVHGTLERAGVPAVTGERQ
ncbi:MAG TPA: glycerol-3-phosphate dehydrogenase/oxidase [Acidimicrobiales bacterium]|nr:glycerol-3-phosphate dehydrogenase/oxidase [Acidimicrobiales bacterium]